MPSPSMKIPWIANGGAKAHPPLGLISPTIHMANM